MFDKYELHREPGHLHCGGYKLKGTAKLYADVIADDESYITVTEVKSNTVIYSTKGAE
jgi:hypothetical protein